MPQPKRSEPLDREERLMAEITRNHESDIRNDIALGVEAKKFLTSDIAQVITDLAESKVKDAEKGLREVDPEDSTRIRDLQTICARYDHFFGCIFDIVAAGDSAYQVYVDSQHSDDS